jgi:hypothetical protein
VVRLVCSHLCRDPLWSGCGERHIEAHRVLWKVQPDDLPTQDHLRRNVPSGVRDVLIYCRDHRCSHYIEVSADRCADHIRLSDIEQDFVGTACGKRGADVRPAF